MEVGVPFLIDDVLRDQLTSDFIDISPFMTCIIWEPVSFEHVCARVGNLLAALYY